MAEEIKAEQVMKAVTELRQTVESKALTEGEIKEKQEKIERDLDAFEKANQELVLTLEADQKIQAELKELVESEKKDAQETKERIQALELEIARGSVGSQKDWKQSDEYKAVNKFVQTGEKKTLRTDIDTGAGYLVGPPEFDNEIIKAITETSPMRSVARVRTVGKKQLEIPVRTAIPTAAFEGENEQATQSESTYGVEQINAFRLTFQTPFTFDMLMDSAFDLEAEIMGDAVEAFAQREGNRFILGTGSKQPEGFLVNATVVANTRTTAGSGAVAGDDLLLLTGDLKVGYNPIYVFNRTTLATLRTLKDSTGAYIWQAGTGQTINNNIAGALPNTIAGERYVVMQDMPDIAVGNLPIAYADFGRGYTVIDRTGMAMIRDDVTNARNNAINMTFHRYVGGQVVLAEAIKALEVSA